MGLQPTGMHGREPCRALPPARPVAVVTVGALAAMRGKIVSTRKKRPAAAPAIECAMEMGARRRGAVPGALGAFGVEMPRVEGPE